LLVDRKVVGDLPEPCYQGFQALLGPARQRRRRQVLGVGDAGNDERIDPVGLLQNAYRLSIAADVAGIGQRAADAFLSQIDERPSFVTATGLHDHQRDGVFRRVEPEPSALEALVASLRDVRRAI
jgi:hypothetical protein